MWSRTSSAVSPSLRASVRTRSTSCALRAIHKAEQIARGFVHVNSSSFDPAHGSTKERCAIERGGTRSLPMGLMTRPPFRGLHPKRGRCLGRCHRRRISARSLDVGHARAVRDGFRELRTCHSSSASTLFTSDPGHSCRAYPEHFSRALKRKGFASVF